MNYLSQILNATAGVDVKWQTCPLAAFFLVGGGEGDSSSWPKVMEG